MNGRIFLGIILIAIGISALTSIPIISFVFAIIVIWLGVRIISGGTHGEFMRDWERVRKVKEDGLDETLIFSGSRKVIESDDFKGGRVVCVFAGGEYDLSEVKTKEKELDIEAVAVLGGVKLIVPKTWKIRVNATGIAGGIDNKTRPTGNGGVLVTLDGASVLGGVEITN